MDKCPLPSRPFELDAMVPSPKYHCEGCATEFLNWSLCLQHLREEGRECHPEFNRLALTKEGRRKLQILCKIGRQEHNSQGCAYKHLVAVTAKKQSASDYAAKVVRFQTDDAKQPRAPTDKLALLPLSPASSTSAESDSVSEDDEHILVGHNVNKMHKNSISICPSPKEFKGNVQGSGELSAQLRETDHTIARVSLEKKTFQVKLEQISIRAYDIGTGFSGFHIDSSDTRRRFADFQELIKKRHEEELAQAKKSRFVFNFKDLPYRAGFTLTKFLSQSDLHNFVRAVY